MENASKALLMAGSMLIAIMIIGALVLMANNLSSYQDSTINNDKEAQIVEFNSQYETYNRPDIRGSDMYSLLNKVIDYNRRKSVVGTGASDEGQTIGFEAMTISVQFPDNTTLKEWTFDDSIRLFKNIGTNNKLTLTETTTNSLENMLKNKIEDLEKKYNSITKKGGYGGQVGITNLVAGIANLFPGVPANEEHRETIAKAVLLYYRNVENSRFEALGVGSKKNFEENFNAKYMDAYKKIQADGSIKEDVYTYYEYIQFKRAYFDCTDVKYNKNTGRIIELTFEYNR